MHKFAALFCLVLLTASPVLPFGTPTIDAGKLLPGSYGEAVSSEYPMPFPARGGDVDWGISLSGGGLRSALFSVGVLKALYDLNMLDDVDVISSVSGGGFASYWLYSRYDGRATTRFGAGAFEDPAFTTNVCTLSKKSEFFPFRRAFGALLSPDDSAFAKYRDAIEWTFGPDDGRDRDEKRKIGDGPLTKLNGLNSQIAAGGAPYFILNTTIADKRTKSGRVANMMQRSFEIGPTYRGSPLLSFADWPAENLPIKTWCDGVALSGAAIRFKLARDVPNYSRELNDVAIKMYDGGFVENLGALPLIERRMKNIIIVDAENDAAYRFPSYRLLKSYLASKGTDLSVKNIDDFVTSSKRGKAYVGSAVAKGYVRYKDGSQSNVYYIKMSRPASIFWPKMDQEDHGPNGEPLPPARRNKTRPSACSGVSPLTTDLLRSNMISYSRFLNDKWFWRYFFKAVPYINYNFPQLATIDQSYYRDQIEAFIALGFFEGSEMKVHTLGN